MTHCAHCQEPLTKYKLRFCSDKCARNYLPNKMKDLARNAEYRKHEPYECKHCDAVLAPYKRFWCSVGCRNAYLINKRKSLNLSINDEKNL